MKEAHEKGAYDELYEQRRAEAEAKLKALRDEGDAGAAKADSIKKNVEAQRELRKRKSAAADALALNKAQLMERGAVSLERLGHGTTEVVLLGEDDGEDDGDQYGGLLETKDYKADVAALAKLEAKEGLTSEDKKKIKRDRNALAAKRSRARKRVEAKKETRHVKALEGRVEELEKEVCLLEDLLSVI